jgi:hypothetical protein
MSWFRAIKGFVRVLIALFVIAQFAGVVSSPLASAQAFAKAAASRVHDHHAQLHDHDGKAVHTKAMVKWTAAARCTHSSPAFFLQ